MWIRSSAGSCMNGKMSLRSSGAQSVDSEVCDSVNELDSGVARPFRMGVFECLLFVGPWRPAQASRFSFNLLDARSGSACRICSVAELRRVRLPNILALADPAITTIPINSQHR